MRCIMRKRAVVIHDLASYGNAALMNIIPILYRLGIEVSPIPTALFTSHGGFKGVSKSDNSNFMMEYTKQWKNLNLEFQGIYLGLFTSAQQTEYAKEFLDNFAKKDSLVVLDPIMGDNGRLYSFMKNVDIDSIKDMVKRAHIITPNLTEACFLLGIPYEESISEQAIREYIIKLSSFGPKYVVITSVPKGDKVSTYSYNKETGVIFEISREKLQGSYPGTGDAFTAILFAKLLQGCALEESSITAVNFVERGIKMILDNGWNPLEGLPLASTELIGSLFM